MRKTIGGVALEIEQQQANRVSVWTVTAHGSGVNRSLGHSAELMILTTVRRRGMGDEGAIERGAIVEVKTGDEAFDREWLVEGAPRDVVERIFKNAKTARKHIAKARSGITITISSGTVSAGMNGTHFDESDVELGCKIVVALYEVVSSIRSDYENDAAKRLKKTGGYYDNGKWVEPRLFDPDASAAAEVEALRKKQDKWWPRASWPARITMVMFCAVLIAAVLAGVFYGCGLNTAFEK